MSFNGNKGGIDVSVTNYFLPQSLDEALVLLEEHKDDLLVMGGGTVTMPLINEGVSAPEQIMGLKHTGLNYIHQGKGQVVIGATTTLSQVIEESPIPLLGEAARNSAGWTIRNMATVGGNFFVPPPAGDFATALLALDAEVKLVSQGQERFVPVSDFYTGFMANVLRPSELLAEIRVPVPEGQTAFIKFGRKSANTPAVVTVAAQVMFEGELVQAARIAMNAVGPHPIRARNAEESLLGSPLDDSAISTAASAAAEECQPFTDAVASEWYRRKMVEVYVSRVLKKIAGKEG